MAKFKTTRKYVKDNCTYPIVSAGYCDLQFLLWFTEADAYTSGVYGWNMNVYEFTGCTITTGYRGMIGPTAKGIREYNDKAEKIVFDNSKTYDERKAEVTRLLNEFVTIQMEAFS